MESLLALTIFREEFSTFFVAMFASLVFIKVMHWLVQDRVDYVEVTPTISILGHARIVLFMALLLAIDAAFLQYTIAGTIQSSGQSVMLLFAFEYVILASTIIRYALKYGMSMVDLAMDGTWTGKGTAVFYLELIADLLHLFVYATFFAIVFMHYGLPLHLVRDLYSTFRNFRSRMHDFLRFRQVTARLDRFPDANAEDLRRCDGVCIICREEMAEAGTNKRLYCGHVFHLHCLRSWLERQQNCPTCRASVFRRPGQPPAPANAAAAAPAAVGDAAAAGAADVGALEGPAEPPPLRHPDPVEPVHRPVEPHAAAAAAVAALRHRRAGAGGPPAATPGTPPASAAAGGASASSWTAVPGASAGAAVAAVAAAGGSPEAMLSGALTALRAEESRLVQRLATRPGLQAGGQPQPAHSQQAWVAAAASELHVVRARMRQVEAALAHVRVERARAAAAAFTAQTHAAAASAPPIAEGAAADGAAAPQMPAPSPYPTIPMSGGPPFMPPPGPAGAGASGAAYPPLWPPMHMHMHMHPGMLGAMAPPFGPMPAFMPMPVPVHMPVVPMALPAGSGPASASGPGPTVAGVLVPLHHHQLAAAAAAAAASAAAAAMFGGMGGMFFVPAGMPPAAAAPAASSPPVPDGASATPASAAAPVPATSATPAPAAEAPKASVGVAPAPPPAASSADLGAGPSSEGLDAPAPVAEPSSAGAEAQESTTTEPSAQAAAAQSEAEPEPAPEPQPVRERRTEAAAESSAPAAAEAPVGVQPAGGEAGGSGDEGKGDDDPAEEMRRLRLQRFAGPQ
ncbi:hypothetical protein HYH03_018731 [Edaphochlamys debaryana]|uniref:RING-type E3 ubiquitin transferase n=1 Tax=Edaphochlamys debaryana TaxID=47281 RepID=A0A835XE36_9CHLO|nr:hypothetical protein HYH03_018731 [Edaphochlamys debaryana]|eukprot:KAG2482343.1 hypothetical protein HYH03_018731 [Edaphochlamys debaryana]